MYVGTTTYLLCLSVKHTLSNTKQATQSKYQINGTIQFSKSFAVKRSGLTYVDNLSERSERSL
jgi:hypothetical protein